MADTPAAPLATHVDPEARSRRNRSSTTNVRSTPEWKEWLAGFAAHSRKVLADTIDEALLRFSRAESYAPPPRR